MPAWLAAVLANPTVVAAVVGVLGFAWHRVTTSSAAQSSTIAHAIAGARSAMATVIATVAPGTSPDQLAVMLTRVATEHVGAVGLDPKNLSPLAAAMINAAVHEAVDTFVQPKPEADRRALASAVANLSQQPAVKAA